MIFAAKINKIYTATLVLLLSILPLNSVSGLASQEQGGYPVIYQLQTGNATSASHELVTIFNNSNNPIDITGWKLVYKSASGNTSTELVKFAAQQADHHLMIAALGYLVAGSSEYKQVNPSVNLSAVFKSGISSSAGHITLMNTENVEVDSLGYGTASQPEGTATQAPPSGKILQRTTDLDGRLKDTNNNADDFEITTLSLVEPNTYEEYVEPEVINFMTLEITEVLPNPAGTDTGKEYVEFYNPNEESVLLGEYLLQIGPSFTKSVNLPNLELLPKQYVALTDQEVDLVLPNTSASLRILYAKNSAEVFVMPNYDQLPDDVVWALGNSGWIASYTQTPGAENIITSTKPCSNGYTRSVNTGNCQKVTVSAPKTSITCPVGQLRNTETNRCRKIEIAKTPATCKEDQVRNIETGRCKKIEATTAKPCPTGQERNKDTGRCRKITAKTDKIAEVKDVETPFVENNAKWWAAGLAGSGSVGYAAYEWRQDVRRKLGTIKTLLGTILNK